MTESLLVHCPLCGYPISLKSRAMLGRKARCKGCAQVVTLSAPEDQDIAPEIESNDPLRPKTAPLFDTASLPRKPSRKKKKPPSQTKPELQRSFLRNEDGSPTISARFLMMACYGFTSGLLVMGLWSGFIWLTGLRMGYAAILVGIAAGAGVKKACGDRNLTLAPALLAASIATMILTTAQIIATEVQHRRFLAEFAAIRERVLPVATSDQDFKRRLAEEIIQKRKEQEIPIDWSQVDEGLRNASLEELLEHPDLYEALYPPDVWGEAEQLFEGYSSNTLDGFREEIRQQWNEGPDAIDVRTRHYLDLLKTSPREFNWHDVFYFFAAITLAFAIARPPKKKNLRIYPGFTAGA